MARPFAVETIALDLPPLVAAFGRRLHDAGVPVSPDRAARLARALRLTAPVARRRLYWTARAVLISDRGQVGAFDRVFAEVFGSGADPGLGADPLANTDVGDPSPPQARRSSAHDGRGELPDTARAAGSDPARADRPADDREVPVATVASDDEVLRAKRFDALEADELARIYLLMQELALTAPMRRTRRRERSHHGRQLDMRRTLRASLRTGGDPVAPARRRRRVVPRRIVLLCDISGSMEPYARAYLQFLTCAAAAPGRAEAFVFATRLTRLTRALHSHRPERAIAAAAAAAPDWSSGTRIADALRAFTDHHGRRGMARGAVIVILSDGWERGDPALVGREMARLRRLAHRIVWVNPRVAARDFAPRAGGMAAALPHCDALVSGHSLDALAEVVAAIAGHQVGTGAASAPAGPPPAPGPSDGVADEPWPSATPVPGSSVAMPSGYGPSRGRTTPGWSLH
jgi:hypothetical protein